MSNEAELLALLNRAVVLIEEDQAQIKALQAERDKLKTALAELTERHADANRRWDEWCAAGNNAALRYIQRAHADDQLIRALLRLYLPHCGQMVDAGSEREGCGAVAECELTWPECKLFVCHAHAQSNVLGVTRPPVRTPLPGVQALDVNYPGWREYLKETP